MKHKLFKLGAATAITLTSFGSIGLTKTAKAATFKTALKKVKINYLPGQGVKIWTNYNAGQFMGFRAKDGTEWNVVKTAVDKSGQLWYMVGDNEWIQARYTVDVETTTTKKTTTQTAKKVATQPAKTTSTITTQKTTSKTTASTTKVDEINKAKKIVNQTIQKSQPTSQAPNTENAIVNLAQQQVGKPYVYGAEGPDKFDCSGLVQYVYAHAGVNLPRTTYDQVKVGQTVSLDQLQPGDLLFWGSASAPYHVAIYIGNNQYVNAATPDQGTILQTITSYYEPSIAKRVL